MPTFISYSHLDRALAKRFAKVFESFGLETWWDDRISLSCPWNQELEHRLATATSIVVLWTKNSTQSEWVRREASLGAAQ